MTGWEPVRPEDLAASRARSRAAEAASEALFGPRPVEVSQVKKEWGVATSPGAYLKVSPGIRARVWSQDVDDVDVPPGDAEHAEVVGMVGPPGDLELRVRWHDAEWIVTRCDGEAWVTDRDRRVVEAPRRTLRVRLVPVGGGEAEERWLRTLGAWE